MANIYDINSLSYTAQENPEWFTRALFGGRLVQGGYISALTGIKGDELLSQIDLNAKMLQADGRDCAWSPNQIIKLSEKKAEVKTYKINLEQCIDTLENRRTKYMLSPGAKNTALPADLENATLELIALELSNEIEEMIMGGDSAKRPNDFDGLEKVLAGSSLSIQNGGVAIIAANIGNVLQGMYDLLPERVLQNEGAGTLFFFGTYRHRRMLRRWLADGNNPTVNGLNIYQEFSLDDVDKKNPKIYFMGVEFVACKGLSEDCIILLDSNNAYLLTDLMSDLENIELGQFPAPMDNTVFIKGRLRLGLTVLFDDETVIYRKDLTLRIAPEKRINLSQTNLLFRSTHFEYDGTGNLTSVPAQTVTVNYPINQALMMSDPRAEGFAVTAAAATPNADGQTQDMVLTVNPVKTAGSASITENLSAQRPIVANLRLWTVTGTAPDYKEELNVYMPLIWQSDATTPPITITP